MANGSSSLRRGNNSSVPLVVILEEAPVMWKEKRRYKNKKKKGGGDDKEDGSVVKFTVPVRGGEDTTSDRYCVYISVIDFPGLYPEACLSGEGNSTASSWQKETSRLPKGYQ